MELLQTKRHQFLSKYFNLSPPDTNCQIPNCCDEYRYPRVGKTFNAFVRDEKQLLNTLPIVWVIFFQAITELLQLYLFFYLELRVIINALQNYCTLSETSCKREIIELTLRNHKYLNQRSVVFINHLIIVVKSFFIRY